MESFLQGLGRRRPVSASRGSLRGLLLVSGVGLILSFIYAAFKSRWSVLGVLPDVLILATVWLALRHELHAAAPAVFVMGFFLDGLSLAPAGVMPLCLILIVIAVRILVRVLEFSSTLYVICLCLFIYSLSNLAIYPLLIYISYGNPPFNVISRYFTIYCAQGVLTALSAPPVFWFLDWITSEGD